MPYNSENNPLFDLTILSIFRQSESYLNRYFKQVEEAFRLNGGKCHAIWLEGDSLDSTYKLLEKQKSLLKSKGHHVTLVKYDNHGPHWPSRDIPQRWAQIATCWNNCLKELLPSKICVSVESDLIWEPSIIDKLSLQLDKSKHVIYPMLMLDQSIKIFGKEWFSDTWGFSRGGRKFRHFPPYWNKTPEFYEDEIFLEVHTGGGMIVSTYEYKKNAHWDTSCCILKFQDEARLFMNKALKIYHPLPADWGLLKKYKMRLIALGF